MTQLNIDGNIYIQGLTLPNNPGVGTINCIISGLSGDTPYEFIVVAVNENGYSGYAGPILVNTLSEFETQEQYIGRPPIVAWGGMPYGVFFGNATTYTSGDTGNYVISSQNLFHPSWNIGGGATGTYGHTAPDGTLTAWAITGNRGQQLILPLGHTYIYSYYINLSAGVTGPTRVDAYVIDGANRLAFRQILPYEAASPSFTPYTVYPNDGITGWRRFAYEFYVPDKNWATVYFTMLYMDNWSGKIIHFWGPQIEKIS